MITVLSAQTSSKVLYVRPLVICILFAEALQASCLLCVQIHTQRPPASLLLFSQKASFFPSLQARIPHIQTKMCQMESLLQQESAHLPLVRPRKEAYFPIRALLEIFMDPTTLASLPQTQHHSPVPSYMQYKKQVSARC